MVVATNTNLGSGTGTGRRIRLDPRERTGFGKLPPKPAAPMLRSTKRNPYPSAPQATRAVRTPGGPQLKARPVKKTTAPGRMRLTNPRSSLRVGVPKVALAGKGTVGILRRAKKRLAGPDAKRQVITKKGGTRIVKTAGRTKITQGGKTYIVTKNRAVVKNRRKGTVLKTSSHGKRSKAVKTWGAGTKTKADDARAARFRGPNVSRFRYTGSKGGSTTVSRRANTPNKIRVRTVGPKGRTINKVIGKNFTKVTGPKGNTKTTKTGYISKERRAKVTPNIGERRWSRGNTKPKSNVPKTPNKPGKVGKNTVRGNWKRIKRFRRLRRRQGARYNQSITKGQLKATTSRRLS